MALTEDEYLKRVEEMNPHLKIVSEYKGSKKPIQYICPDCKEVNEIALAQILYRKPIKRCLSCSGRSVAIDEEEYLKRVKEVNPHFEIISDYEGIKKPIKYVCHNCNQVSEVARAEQLYSHKYKNNSCSNCNSKKVPFEDFLQKIREINPKFEIVGEYNGLSKPITYKCPYCSDKISIKSAGWLLDYKNRGCKTCAGFYKLTEFEYLKRVKEINPNLKILSKYKGANKSITYKCPNCKGRGKLMAHTLYRKEIIDCQQCSDNVSYGERITKGFLEELGFKFKTQHVFENLAYKSSLRFDFYLPNEDVCIEYQGRQHYEPIDYFGGERTYLEQVKRDELKRKFCKSNGIKLIEIPYYEKDIKGFLLNELDLKIVA